MRTRQILLCDLPYLLFEERNEHQKNKPKNNGIMINENGIKGLKISSKVSEFDIQYKLEIKYPKPNNHPILKDTHFPFLEFDKT